MPNDIIPYTTPVPKTKPQPKILPSPGQNIIGGIAILKETIKVNFVCTQFKTITRNKTQRDSNMDVGPLCLRVAVRGLKTDNSMALLMPSLPLPPEFVAFQIPHRKSLLL